MKNTYAKIQREIRSVLANEGLVRYAENLEGYKYVEELHDMVEGSYVRWIHLQRRELTNGAFLVLVDIREDGLYLLMKKKFGQMFSVWADECLLFQKIRSDEHVLLMAMERAMH